MIIKFRHNDEIINAEVSTFDKQHDFMVIFPETKTEEFGFSILIYKQNGRWRSDNALEQKNPLTFINLLSSLNIFQIGSKENRTYKSAA